MQLINEVLGSARRANCCALEAVRRRAFFPGIAQATVVRVVVLVAEACIADISFRKMLQSHARQLRLLQNGHKNFD